MIPCLLSVGEVTGTWITPYHARDYKYGTYFLCLARDSQDTGTTQYKQRPAIKGLVERIITLTDITLIIFAASSSSKNQQLNLFLYFKYN